MIHAPCRLSAWSTNGAASPRKLVVQLRADTGPAGYRLRGMLEIEGLDAWRIDALEAALARTLGGRATLMLGPADLDNLLDGRNVESAARRIVHEYDLTPAQLAAKAGISEYCATSLLTTDHKWRGGRPGERRRSHHVIHAIAALALRLVTAPTPGEVLRRQRTGPTGNPRSPVNVAAQIGVPPAVYRAWEDDEAPVPPDMAYAVTRALGLPLDPLAAPVQDDDESDECEALLEESTP